jgi:hypothetical protein
VSLLLAASGDEPRFHVACASTSAQESSCSFVLSWDAPAPFVPAALLPPGASRHSCTRSLPGAAGDLCLLLTLASLAQGLMQRQHSGVGPTTTPASCIVAIGPAIHTSLCCSSIFIRGEQVCAALRASDRTAVGAHGARADWGVPSNVSLLSMYAGSHGAWVRVLAGWLAPREGQYVMGAMLGQGLSSGADAIAGSRT